MRFSGPCCFNVSTLFHADFACHPSLNRPNTYIFCGLLLDFYPVPVILLSTLGRVPPSYFSYWSFTVQFNTLAERSTLFHFIFEPFVAILVHLLFLKNFGIILLGTVTGIMLWPSIKLERINIIRINIITYLS